VQRALKCEAHHKRPARDLADCLKVGHATARSRAGRSWCTSSISAPCTQWRPCPVGRRAFFANSLLPVLGDVWDCGCALLVRGDLLGRTSYSAALRSRSAD